MCEVFHIRSLQIFIYTRLHSTLILSTCPFFFLLSNCLCSCCPCRTHLHLLLPPNRLLVWKHLCNSTLKCIGVCVENSRGCLITAVGMVTKKASLSTLSTGQTCQIAGQLSGCLERCIGRVFVWVTGTKILTG